MVRFCIILVLSEPWEAVRSARYRATSISLRSHFYCSFRNSRQRSSRADCSDLEWFSVSYLFLILFLQRRSMSTLAALDWCSSDCSQFFLIDALSLSLTRCSRSSWISRTILAFSLRSRFSLIFFSSLARICFYKEFTSSCIRFSFSYTIRCSYSRFCRSVYFSFQRSGPLLGSKWDERGGYLALWGSWFPSRSYRVQFTMEWRYRGCAYCCTTLLTLRFHSGFSFIWLRTSRMASSRFWLTIYILMRGLERILGSS